MAYKTRRCISSISGVWKLALEECAKRAGVLVRGERGALRTQVLTRVLQQNSASRNASSIALDQ